MQARVNSSIVIISQSLSSGMLRLEIKTSGDFAHRQKSSSYELRALSRLLSRCFNLAARFRWCNPFDAALSMLEVASRYAVFASSTLFSAIFFSNFLIAERKAERWLILWIRLFALWRARFLACGEFAKFYPLKFGLNSVDAGISSIWSQKSRASKDARSIMFKIRPDVR